MLPRTDQSKQRALSQILNQISQNLNRMNASTSNTTDQAISVDLPGVNIDLGTGIDIGTGTTNPTESGNPGSIREALLGLQNEQVEVTTSFDTITGTLAAVETDYAVIVEGDGSVVDVPFDQIESVRRI